MPATTRTAGHDQDWRPRPGLPAERHCGYRRSSAVTPQSDVVSGHAWRAGVGGHAWRAGVGGHAWRAGVGGHVSPGVGGSCCNAPPSVSSSSSSPLTWGWGRGSRGSHPFSSLVVSLSHSQHTVAWLNEIGIQRLPIRFSLLAAAFSLSDRPPCLSF